MSILFCRAFSVKPSVFNEFEIVPYHESFCVITLLACANWTTHLRLPPPPPTHPYISSDIFKSAIFIFGYGFRPHVSGESGMRIRSLEWKFFMKRFESGIVCTLNPDIILSGDLSKIEPSSLPWMLYSRWQPRSQVLSRQSKVQISCALRRMLCCQYSQRSSGYESESGYVSDTCGRANSICIPETCGRKNFLIRKEKVLDSKLSRTVGQIPLGLYI